MSGLASAEVLIREPLGSRQAALPLIFAGEAADVPVPGVVDATVRIDGTGTQWFASAGDSILQVNGMAQRERVPLVDGDVLRIGDARVVVHPSKSELEVLHLAGNLTVAPVQIGGLPGEEVIAGVREIAAASAPNTADPNATARLRSRAPAKPFRWVAVASALAVIGIAAWVMFAIVPVALQLTPAAAVVRTPGTLGWQAGDRIFLMPGRRTLEISHAGYRSQRLTLDVTHGLSEATALPVKLDLLPGVLAIDTQGEKAELFVDGNSVAQLPGDVDLAAGPHDVIVRAPRRIDVITRIEVQGGGQRQTLDVKLLPAWGELVLDTEPAGARISVDGEDRGTAPLRIELDAGLRKLSIAAPGRRGWTSQIAIIAGKTMDLGRIDLAVPAPAVLRVADSSSAQAATSDLADAMPAPATPVEIRKPPASSLQSALLGKLVLLPAGSYTQGSDRREQGRRANEAQREVTLTHAFYLAEAEVSNAQFRAFRATHVAGVAMEKSLDLDSQAVTVVSWSDAVEFCNWLSLRESLPAAYERRDGRWQLLQPRNSGYRLPTEAEWEYAARYIDGKRWQRYAWGDQLPPPSGAANLAGQESLPPRNGPDVRLAAALPDYRDEHAVIAPVRSYASSATGFFDLGGNVSEWTQDVYTSLPDPGAVTDPVGAAADGPHAIRGANWRTAAIAELRLAWRDVAAAPAQTIGFRVARDADGAP